MNIKTDIWHNPKRFFKIIFFYQLISTVLYLNTDYGIFLTGIFIITTLLTILIWRSHNKHQKEELLADEEYQAWLKKERQQK